MANPKLATKGEPERTRATGYCREPAMPAMPIGINRGEPIRKDACSAESDSEHDNTNRQQNEDQQNGTKMPASVQGEPFQLA
jgi:hypothetical protein